MNMWNVRKATPEAAPTPAAPATAKPQPRTAKAASSDQKRADWLIDLKVRIHRQLIDRINLSLLDKLPREQIGTEISQIIAELLEEDRAVLNGAERQSLVEDVLDELLPRAA